MPGTKLISASQILLEKFEIKKLLRFKKKDYLICWDVPVDCVFHFIDANELPVKNKSVKERSQKSKIISKQYLV